MNAMATEIEKQDMLVGDIRQIIETGRKQAYAHLLRIDEEKQS